MKRKTRNILIGVSMGGATSLFAFQDEPRIAALFLEGTFASLLAVVADEMTGYGLPGFMAQPAAAVFRLVSHENIMAHTPIAAIRLAGDRPVYIVHSRGDRRISVSQAHELAAAALDAGVNVKAWFPERSEHLQTPALYPQEFEERLVGFFRENLAR